MKNYQNLKGAMIGEHSLKDGETLSELTNECILVKQVQGIYAKPRTSRFGAVLHSVEKIVQAIAVRDNAEVLPSGMTALAKDVDKMPA